jgi:hypothetical protein
MIINNGKIIIRQATKDDASGLVDDLNVIGGESNFLTFGTGEFGISVEDEE